MINQGQGDDHRLQVLLEVVPTHSLAAAIDADAELAGNPYAAESLSNAGMEVDADWPALRLGQQSRLGSLAGRSRFESVRGAVNRVGGGVNRVVEALPFDVQVPMWSPPERQTVLFRAKLPAGEAALRALAIADEQVRIVGVYADPVVGVATRGESDPSLGTVAQVGELMNVERLHAHGLTGEGVPVVVVDTGLNVEHLHSLGRTHEFDRGLSYTTDAATHDPGQFPVAHGTMAAFQVGIAGPAAKLADHAVLVSRAQTPTQPLMHAWLSDIQPAYLRLHEYLMSLEPADRKLVVTNSWAMIDESWDLPATEILNYSDNPDHPFNRTVRNLVAAGADVLFAAGNCGDPLPVSGCRFNRQPICGANSLAEVITVGAVDIDSARLGYSSQGPGRITDRKPDVCGYSHYDGSGVYHSDWGTSTACPSVAGLVSAVRTRYSADALPPHELKAALEQTAKRPEGATHSPDIGWGVVDPAALIEALP